MGCVAGERPRQRGAGKLYCVPNTPEIGLFS